MKHFLTEQEFKEFLLRERDGEPEFSLAYETEDGCTESMTFREVFFNERIFLYSLPDAQGIGIIQCDMPFFSGWDDVIHELWGYYTENLLIKPFFEV